MAEIMGYSERGLVNSLFESILSSSNPKTVLRKLLTLGVSLDPKQSDVQFFTQPNISDFTVFIEPSLSDFGNPDAIILLDYSPISKQDGNNTTYTPNPAMIFLEAKLNTFTQSTPGYKKKTENSSTILHEIYNKAWFAFHLMYPSKYSVREGFPLYISDLKEGKKNLKRSIGSDRVVLDLVEKLRGRFPYFFALTTDNVDRASTKAGDNIVDPEIDELMKSICRKNESVQDSFIFNKENWVNFWLKGRTYLWSWQEIISETRSMQTEGESSFGRFHSNVNWNVSKFRFNILKDITLHNLVNDWLIKNSLSYGKKPRKNTNYKTIYRKHALFTYRISDSFDGPIFEVNGTKKYGSGKMVIPMYEIADYIAKDLVGPSLGLLHSHFGIS